MHSAPLLEALLEAAAEVVAGEVRQQPRHRRYRSRHDVDVSHALAVAALVRVPLVEHLRLRLPPEQAEEPCEKAHELILPLCALGGQA
jgi:hypothetical protein